MDPPIELIRNLIDIAEEAELAELTVESGEHSVTIRTEEARDTALSPARAQPGPQQIAEEVPAEPLPSRMEIVAPMMGVFYRSPTPGAPSFIEVGSSVEIGQTIGLIEAMKVFNEVVSDLEGRVVAIPARNEQLVNLGEVLVMLQPAE